MKDVKNMTVEEVKAAFLKEYDQYIKRPGSEKLREWLVSSSFFEDPASSRYHLNVPGGLALHSLHVFQRLKKLVAEEEAVEASDETIAIVALLHDLCKVGTYATEYKNVKTYDPDIVAASPSYSVKKDENGSFVWQSVKGYKAINPYPFGHGEKSVDIIRDYMALTTEEKLAIRWHMGFSDISFKAGSQDVGAAFEMCPLGVVAHMADLCATYFDEKAV